MTMPRHCSRAHPVMSLLAAPVLRLAQLPPDGWLLAGIMGGVSWLAGDMTVWLLGLLCFTALADLVFGRAVAHKQDTFDSRISEWGLHSKGAGLVMVVAFRLVGSVLGELMPGYPPALLAVIAASALIYHDIESLDRHRQTLGGRPIPLVTQMLEALRKLSASMLPKGGDS